MHVLFVSNGHGEAAIADRIAVELRVLEPGAQLDHLALVGDGHSDAMRDAGPRRAMPSGGLIAMGNVRNVVRDVSAGLLGLTLAQYRFLRAARGRYDVAIAIGDAYALAMTSIARAPTVFVGSAKSIHVAAYGRFEERLLRRAAACFVRDGETARRLQSHGLRAEAANVIVDLFATADDPRAQDAVEGFAPALALFPGSRDGAYGDASFLLDVVRELARADPSIGAVLSVARGLDISRFAAVARERGFEVVPREDDAAIPFELRAEGREIVRAWRGALGPVLRRVSLVLGQAGTANEAAAAAGVAVVAFERERDATTAWYRKRQRGLLGDALLVLPAARDAAVDGVRCLLADRERRERMAQTGKARMGAPGGARRVAERVASLIEVTT